MKSPNLKARATAYFTEFKDQTKILFAFNEFLLRRADFASVILTDIDQRHTGVELALEGKVMPGLTAYGVASMGQYIYTSRPSAFVSLDEAEGFIEKALVIEPHNAELLATKATIWFRKKDTDMALELLEKAISINPKNVKYFVQKKLIYEFLGDKANVEKMKL